MDRIHKILFILVVKQKRKMNYEIYSKGKEFIKLIRTKITNMYYTI